jgi:hypothetical protein
MRRLSWGKWFAIIAVVASAAVVPAQSFNVDLDVLFGPPATGAGVPSASFGGAAEQVGVWNLIGATWGGPTGLLNLTGGASGVQLFKIPGGGFGNGFNNPTLTGDHALLLKDGANFESARWSFSGLANGLYKLFTYAVHPSGVVTNTSVTVSGAFEPTMIVTGPVQGNSFLVRKTHSVHDVFVTNGVLSVDINRGTQDVAYVNGFQLVAVPEPSSILTLGLTLSLFLILRRRLRS